MSFTGYQYWPISLAVLEVFKRTFLDDLVNPPNRQLNISVWVLTFAALAVNCYSSCITLLEFLAYFGAIPMTFWATVDHLPCTV